MERRDSYIPSLESVAPGDDWSILSGHYKLAEYEEVGHRILDIKTQTQDCRGDTLLRVYSAHVVLNAAELVWGDLDPEKLDLIQRDIAKTSAQAEMGQLKALRASTLDLDYQGIPLAQAIEHILVVAASYDVPQDYVAEMCEIITRKFYIAQSAAAGPV